MGTQMKIRNLLIPIILVLTLALAGCVHPPDVSFSSAPLSLMDQSSSDIDPMPAYPPEVADIINKVGPAVVAVDAEHLTYDANGCQVIEHVSGSGWILNQNGFIVTNNHVVEGADRATVILESGQTYIAKTIRTDPVDDVAVIDIGSGDLTGMPIGDPAEIRVGDQVIALGNFLGIGIRATHGIISSTHSTFVVNNQESLYNLLETTVPIVHGNSGGPLINMNGEVVGIATAASLNRSGTEIISYAISSGVAGPIIQQLIQNGQVVHAWFGANISSVSELRKMGCELNLDQGAFITQVTADSPAEKNGFKAGDVISRFDEQYITNADDLVEAVRSSKIGQQVNVTYWRDNTEYTDTVTLVQDPRH